jgi:hypothetical protein
VTCNSCGSANLTPHAAWTGSVHQTGWLLCGDCGNKQRADAVAAPAEAVEAPAEAETTEAPAESEAEQPAPRRRRGGE